MALAVMLGAFGAHALKSRLDAYSISIWEKAVFYHFIHALGLLVVPAFARLGSVSESAAARISMLLIAGIVLFSGSLYILALTGVATLGAVTPLGGVSFIAAWFCLAYSLARN
jgi:hypothetical protein